MANASYDILSPSTTGPKQWQMLVCEIVSPSTTGPQQWPMLVCEILSPSTTGPQQWPMLVTTQYHPLYNKSSMPQLYVL